MMDFSLALLDNIEHTVLYIGIFFANAEDTSVFCTIFTLASDQ